MSASPKSLIVPSSAISGPAQPAGADVPGEPHRDAERNRQYQDCIQPVDRGRRPRAQLGEVQSDAEEPLGGRENLRIAAQPREEPEQDQARADPGPPGQDVRRAREDQRRDPPAAPPTLLVPLDLVELHALGLRREPIAQDEQMDALAAVLVPVAAGLAVGAERAA